MFARRLIEVLKLQDRAWGSVLSRGFRNDLFEPPYLEELKPKYPVYEALTVQIKGYDYPPLEHYQKYIHKMAEYFNINVESNWAHPAKNFEIRRFKPQSSVPDSTYKLLHYERNIKLVNVKASRFSVFVEMIQCAQPEGIDLNIFAFDTKHEEDRYVPDHELNIKKKMLDDLGGPLPTT